MATAEEREAVLQAFEAGLAQVDRQQYAVTRMRWHCRITDPQGHGVIVAEYRLAADGQTTRVWVLDPVLWPAGPIAFPEDD